jgi:hypothetical protein
LPVERRSHRRLTEGHAKLIARSEIPPLTLTEIPPPL